MTVDHTQEAFSRVSHLLPDDIVTVHDYGCWDGQGTLWLTTQYPTVVGFDINLRYTTGAVRSGLVAREGDVFNPQEDADLIYVGHVLEGDMRERTMSSRLSAVEELRHRCRFLLLHVHRWKNEIYDWQDTLVPDALLHSVYTCNKQRTDSVTLLGGYL